MNKSVSFPENPVLVRQISNQSEARRQNSQTPIEKRMATNSFYMEEKQKINTDKEAKKKYENKRKYINTPINKRVTDAVLKGNKEDANIRKEAILEDHRYGYWWLGGKKSRRTRTKKRRTRTKKTKTRTK